MRNSMSPRHRVTQPAKGVRESRVQQAPAKAANVNNVVGKHLSIPGRGLSSIGDPGATRKPMFIDVPSLSYHEMLNKVADIDSAFRSLGSRLRGRFRNDAYQLLRFVEDPANRLEAISLGLILPTEEDHEAMRAAQAAKAARQHAVRPEDGEQLDLEEQAARAGQRPDDEAQPSYAAAPKKGGARSKTA